MRRPLSVLIAGSLLLLAAAPAMAWGPRAQMSIVTTAAGLIAKSSGIALAKVDKELREGAQISNEMMAALYPDYPQNPVRAIESEIFLLQRVKGDRLDPYFAYRLGALGKLVATVTAPMRDVSTTYRNLYYADVENAIARAALKPAPRVTVDPAAYFPARFAQAAVNDEVIQKEYQSGAGFDGVASMTLGVDASRSVNAVADVWHTIVAGTTTASVSEAQLQRYVIDALDFYIRRGNELEMDAAEARFAALVNKSPDMRVRIGDMYYARGFQERAVAEYQQVIAGAPGRRDVVQKIADYYMERGEGALAGGRLESAYDDFQTALQADPLHPAAEARRIHAGAMIADRDARLEANRQALARAEELTSLAESEALRGRTAEAIALLRQANDTYGEVTEEFPPEYQRSIRGVRENGFRMETLQQNLMANAASFSGTGFAGDAQAFARAQAAEVDRRALEELLRKSYQSEMQRLREDLAAAAAL